MKQPRPRFFCPWIIIFYLLTSTTLLAAEVQTSGDTGNSVNVLPVPVVFFTPETGTGAGGGIYITYGKQASEDGEKIGESKSTRNLIVPFFVYTEKNQSVARLYWDLWPLGDRTRIYTVLGYTNYPDTFFGIGNTTKQSDSEMFREVYGAADFDIEHQAVRNAFVGLLLRSDTYEILEKEPLGQLEESTEDSSQTVSSKRISGAKGGSIRGVGLQLRYLSLNHPFTPTEGYNLLLRHIQYGATFGGQFKYSADELRLKRYFAVMGNDSIALEVLLQRSIGDVPFRKLPMLGGQYLLRGFFLGRFRDNALQAIQTEYRHILTDTLGINIFLSSGSVGQDWQSALQEKWHLSGGIGLRYIIVKEDNLGFRFDIARNEEETSVYFGAGEAF